MRLVATIAIAVCCAVLLASARRQTRADQLTEDYSFEQYVVEFNRDYIPGTIEYKMRAANFEYALSRVLDHNRNPSRTYNKGINHLSDRTDVELTMLRGSRHTPEYKSRFEVPFVRNGSVVPAATVDYRTAFPAVLTGVKDQGYCGDCWAHAVTEAIESAYAMQTGDLYVLSQQQVTSCTPASGPCYSCNGSFPKLGYDYVAGGGVNDAFGLVEEWVYPFQSYLGTFPQCQHEKTFPVQGFPFRTSVQITGFRQIATNDQEAVMEALTTLGPLSILVDASVWNDYESGVFTGCSFGPGFGLDHAVLLVGYGHDSATDLDYWIVRNSWSAGWGESGYIRIAKTPTNQCGNTWGLSCLGNPPNITSCGPCGLLTDAQFPIINATKWQPPASFGGSVLMQ